MIKGCKYDRVTHIAVDMKISYSEHDDERNPLVFLDAKATLGGSKVPPATLQLIRPGTAWTDEVQDALHQLSVVLRKHAESLIGDPQKEEPGVLEVR